MRSSSLLVEHCGRSTAVALTSLVMACSASSSPVNGDAGRSDVDVKTDARKEAEAGCPTSSLGSLETVDPALVPRLSISGDIGSTAGVFDPSLAWPSGSPTGFLSYSTAESSGLFTRIASTVDGKSFRYVTDANAYIELAVSTTDTSVCGSDSCDGRIVHETSSLIDDPTDPEKLHRFKLFDYSYVIVPGASPPAQHTWGYIGLYTAPSPMGPWSSPGAKAVGWTSSAPGVSSSSASLVLNRISALSDCDAFTEPAALVDEATGLLYLALGCVATSGVNPEPRVILLVSRDHASTFTYVGPLLTAGDGIALGSVSPGIQPTDLFQVNGNTYLVVSTLGPTPTVPDAPSGYTSCVTVKVASLSAAKAQRDGSGRPISVRKLVAPGGGFAGACAFKPAFASGYLVPEVIASSPQPDAIFESDVRCP